MRSLILVKDVKSFILLLKITSKCKRNTWKQGLYVFNSSLILKSKMSPGVCNIGKMLVSFKYIQSRWGINSLPFCALSFSKNAYDRYPTLVRFYGWPTFLSRLPQAWHDIGIWFSIIHPSVCLSVCPSVNIWDHPSVDSTVQVRNSETLRYFGKTWYKYKAFSDNVTGQVP